MVSSSVRTGMVTRTSVVSVISSGLAILGHCLSPGYQGIPYFFHIHPLNSLLNSCSNRSTSNTSHGRLLVMYASNRDWYLSPGNISAKRSNNRVISSDMVFSSSVFTMSRCCTSTKPMVFTEFSDKPLGWPINPKVLQ